MTKYISYNNDSYSGSYYRDAQRCRISSKRNRRRRPMDDDDDSGHGWVTTKHPKPKKRKPVTVPTDSEQAELLKKAIEKELNERGNSGPRLRCAMREYRHVYHRQDRRE